MTDSIFSECRRQEGAVHPHGPDATFGHLFPGNVFEDINGNRMGDIDKIQGRLTLVW